MEEIESLRDSYDPRALLEREPRIRRVVDSLVDGTFSDGGTGMFQDLYASLLEGASWHRPDNYFLLYDFLPYCDTRLYSEGFDEHGQRRHFFQRQNDSGIRAGYLAGDVTN